MHEWEDDVSEQQLALAESVGDTKRREDSTPSGAELFKRWNRAGSLARFVSVKPWPATGMLTFDIGEVQGEKLVGSTKCFVSGIEFLTFLRRRAKGEREYLHYGGSVVDGQPVSRVFKLAPWKDAQGGDTSDWVAKCGHFAATRTKDGGFVPQKRAGAELSVHSIKISDAALDELQVRIELALIAWAADHASWITDIMAKRT